MLKTRTIPMLAALVAAAGIAVGNPAAAATLGPIGPAPARVQQMVGVWAVTKSTRGDPPQGTDAPFSPAMQKVYDKWQNVLKTGGFLTSRNTQCIPTGFPMLYSLTVRMEANAQYVTQTGGDGPAVRVIFLNRTQHTRAKDIVPSFGGDAIAHWEGRTLVVDTIGLDPGNNLIYGLELTDKNVHFIERITMPNADEMNDDVTVEDTYDFSRPFHYVVQLKRQPYSTHMDICSDGTDNASLNLTPPSGGYIPPGAKE